jgi:hypothetical protein
MKLTIYPPRFWDFDGRKLVVRTVNTAAGGGGRGAGGSIAGYRGSAADTPSGGTSRGAAGTVQP